jgi:hypothetical protein
MLKSDQNDVLQNAVSDDFQYIDYDKRFNEFVIKFIIIPFGKPLNQDLMELFSQQKLDLNETLIKDLKATVLIDGARKSLRKPQTPTKIAPNSLLMSQSGKRSVTRMLNLNNHVNKES